MPERSLRVPLIVASVLCVGLGFSLAPAELLVLVAVIGGAATLAVR